jgi:hypothetical protein
MVLPRKCIAAIRRQRTETYSNNNVKSTVIEGVQAQQQNAPVCSRMSVPAVARQVLHRVTASLHGKVFARRRGAQKHRTQQQVPSASSSPVSRTSVVKRFPQQW